MKLKLKLLDLTHPLSSKIPTWNGACGFNMSTTHDYLPEEMISFRVQELHMQAGIGTHIDAPAHCFADGKTIGDIELSDLFSPCTVVDCSEYADENFKLEMQHIANFEKKHGKIAARNLIIVHTGWGRFFADPNRYRNNLKFPIISRDAAEYFLSLDAVGIGIDTLSPDRPDGGFIVHELMLKSGKYIIENVANANFLLGKHAYALAMPLKIPHATEAPIRLVGLIAEEPGENIELYPSRSTNKR